MPAVPHLVLPPVPQLIPLLLHPTPPAASSALVCQAAGTVQLAGIGGSAPSLFTPMNIEASDLEAWYKSLIADASTASFPCLSSDLCMI
jgi:hypothetical protein